MGKSIGFSANRLALRKCGPRKCDPQEQVSDWNVPQDQISKLPDDILVAILYFLTFKEAAVTSVISRRWVHLWKYYSRLDFDATKSLNVIACDHNLRPTERVKYVDWVNQVLHLHVGSEIEEFRICFDLDKANRLHIDNWVKFAFERRVQRLELDLTRWGMFASSFIDDVYNFPLELVFPQSSISPFAQPHPNHGLNPLKTLCLKCVNVTGESIKLFLLNCPFLESLLVHGSQELVDLEVSGQSLSLRSLEIYYCKNLNSIKICNTNLVSFKILGVGEVVLLQGLPFLVEVYIGSLTFVGDAFSKLSSCLSNLEILTLRFKDAGKFKELLEFQELSRLKELTLVLETRWDCSLLGFAALANAFPFLQKCAIESWWNLYLPCKAEREVEKIPCSPHHCLKVVELRGYFGRVCDLELAMYFMENAVALEELVIDPRDQDNRHFRLPTTADQIELENTARNFAKEQFEGITIPPNIKLSIL